MFFAALAVERVFETRAWQFLQMAEFGLRLEVSSTDMLLFRDMSSLLRRPSKTWTPD